MHQIAKPLHIFFIILLIAGGLKAQPISRSGAASLPPAPNQLRQFPCEGNVLGTFDFEAGLPADWQVLDLDTLSPHPNIATFMGKGWQTILDFQDSSNTAMASPSWYADSGRSEDWLISDTVSIGANTCLSWYAYSQDRFFPESYEVRISTTTADTAGFMAEDALLVVEEEGYDLNYRSVNLAAYSEQEVFIAFRHTSFDQFILVLDDILLAEVEQTDVGPVEFVSINADTFDLIPIRAAIRNFGSDSIVADSVLKVSYSIDGGTAQTIILSDSIVLAPNDTLQFVHDSLWIPEENRAYVLCIWTSGIPDDNLANDTICMFVGIGAATAIDDQLEADAFRIYPNPVSELLHIRNTDPVLNGTLQLVISDAFGRKLYDVAWEQRQAFTIDMEGFNTGLYFLRLMDQSGRSVVKKIVKY